MSKEKFETGLIKEAKEHIDNFFSTQESYIEEEIDSFVESVSELYEDATPAEQEVIDSYALEKVKLWLKKFKH